MNLQSEEPWDDFPMRQNKKMMIVVFRKEHDERSTRKKAYDTRLGQRDTATDRPRKKNMNKNLYYY